MSIERRAALLVAGCCLLGITEAHEIRQPSGSDLDFSVVLQINPEARVSAMRTAARLPAFRCGHETLLPLRVRNDAYVTASVRVHGSSAVDSGLIRLGEVVPKLEGSRQQDLWLPITVLRAGPLEVRLAFDAGDGTADLAGRNEVHLALRCAAAPRVEKNVVYGMSSGVALLMDVHRPGTPNGFGLLLIAGSGWHAAQTYDAKPLKDGGSALFASIPALLDAGYTLFVINHRAAPRFRYPAAVEGAQRAVRFVRTHAAEYGIDAQRLGAVGYSSGGRLALLLATLEGAELMHDAAQGAGAEVKLIRVPGGRHGFARDLSLHPDWPDVLGETVRWLDRHVKEAVAPRS